MMVIMKCITCLLQGMTDRPLQNLGGVTPLQKASVPCLDALVQHGGVVAVVPPEGSCSVETALLSFLSGRKSMVTIRRGPLEASSLGYALSPQQRAFSVRFISLGRGVVVDVSDEILSDSEGRSLCDALNAAMGHQGCHYIPLAGPCAMLITDNPALISVEDVEVPHPVDAVGRQWHEVLPGEAEARALMERACSVLTTHEINALREDLEEPIVNALLISEGGHCQPWSMLKGDNDVTRWLLYTTSAAEEGVAKAIGMDVWSLPREEKKFDHVAMILQQLDAVLENKDNIALMFPYLWRSTYKGDLLQKVKTIEWLDHNLIAPLVAYCERRHCQLMVTALRHSDITKGRAVPGNVPALLFPAGEAMTLPSGSFNEDLLEAPLPHITLHDLSKPGWRPILP